jgi:hypothetical protein
MLNHYQNLTHFLIYWSSYKKFQFVPLVRPDMTLPSAWRLRNRAKMKKPMGEEAL